MLCNTFIMRSTANECSWILKQDLVIIVLRFHQLHFFLYMFGLYTLHTGLFSFTSTLHKSNTDETRTLKVCTNLSGTTSLKFFGRQKCLILGKKLYFV